MLEAMYAIGEAVSNKFKGESEQVLYWPNTFEILGIIFNIELMSEITKLNIYRKVGEVKNLICTWHSRNLTPYGKITIIKSPLMSKFSHMLLSLPSPSDELIEELHALFRDFL